MTIQVIADGADGYRLLSADSVAVGWIRGRVIGVAGFDDDEAVVRAAMRGYVVLASWLERQHLHPLPTLGTEETRCVHDGAYRWIVVGSVPVARLVPVRERDPASCGQAFEIVLRGAISEGMAIHAALIVLRAAHGKIAAADISWAQRNHAVGASQVLAPTTHLDLEAR
jgi:hypothetical protein